MLCEPPGRLTECARPEEGGGERTAGVGTSVCKDSAVWGPVKLPPGTAVEE